jgi:hypothetical protein
MTARQHLTAGDGGLGHGVGVDSNPGTNPMSKVPQGKRLTPPTAHPFMRSRTMDRVGGAAPGENHARSKGAHLVDMALGAAVLSEAHSSKDDRTALAHLGVGSALPLTLKTNKEGV